MRSDPSSHRRTRASRIQGQYQVVVHVEEDDGAVLELGADDPLGRQPQAVAVEGEGFLQIADAQRDDFDSRFHVDSILVSMFSVSSISRKER